MSKAWKRRIAIIATFLLFAALYFLSTQNRIVFLYSIPAIIIMLVLEYLLYPKRNSFIYALAGLVAGIYSGKLLFALFSQIAPAIFAAETAPYFELITGYLGFLLPLFSGQKVGFPIGAGFSAEGDKKPVDLKILDTSVVIDGRISDIGETGFISGTLILPKFVLNEIQSLADSKDPIKRSRARRGLDVLNKLKEVPGLDLKIFSRDFPEIKGVDAKLIALAKELNASIITNDYNLNKVAKLDGILILNLNDLANALKPVLLPGEEMELDVLKEGKENNQGIGYLSDGTMVVLANGASLIGKKIHVKVTSILQTSAGRIIFTEPKR